MARSIGSSLENHKPFDSLRRPEVYLWALVGMIVEARIANPQQMFVVRLPLDGIFGQGLLSVFKSQRVLKDGDQLLFSCQTTFPIEQEIRKPSVPGLLQLPDLAISREDDDQDVRVKYYPRRPTH